MGTVGSVQRNTFITVSWVGRKGTWLVKPMSQVAAQSMPDKIDPPMCVIDRLPWICSSWCGVVWVGGGRRRGNNESVWGWLWCMSIRNLFFFLFFFFFSFYFLFSSARGGLVFDIDIP